jgi:pimeloyl-ACP methyl ester carboxylesterase
MEVILMGKSWGGQSVATYSSIKEHAKFIRKVVLIAPGIPKGKKDIVFALGKVQIPVFLGWAKDDMIMSNSVVDVWMKAFDEDNMNEKQQQQLWLHTYNVESGGHLIFNEYAEPIEQFLLLDH